MKITIDGVEVEVRQVQDKVPDKCKGCVGEFDFKGICCQLPVGCSTTHTIWIRKENELH